MLTLVVCSIYSLPGKLTKTVREWWKEGGEEHFLSKEDNKLKHSELANDFLKHIRPIGEARVATRKEKTEGKNRVCVKIIYEKSML